jgi:transcriptional regulator with XRE-family HTH domain
MIAAIEAGTKKGAIGTLKRLAAALQVDLETLLKRSVPERSRPHRLQ